MPSETAEDIALSTMEMTGQTQEEYSEGMYLFWATCGTIRSRSPEQQVL